MGSATQGVASCMMTAPRVISFRGNVSNQHGEVYRSSGIFYVPPTNQVRTTLSFLNYWALKRDLQVAVVASTRTMSGELVGRQRLRFDLGQVINFSPDVAPGFEGSVEVEVFAAENMVIPYAAIIAWYETRRGLGIVHSYARAYSNHEVEEQRTVTRGREGCWTITDDALTRSFAVFHNGGTAVGAQTLHLRVTNAIGQRQSASWELPVLRPYESVKVLPGQHLEGLQDFLAGQPGQAELDYELGGGFTRMLVGNERLDASDLQVTHSNFNFTLQATDMAGLGAVGWMEVPDLQVATTEVLVYPQSVQGRYRSKDTAGEQREFNTGEVVSIRPKVPSSLQFSITEGEFPTRLVTGLRVAQSQELLSNECSLGVITALQPPKRLWWGPLRCDDGAVSKLIIHDLPQVYGGIADDVLLSLRLFSARESKPLEVSLVAGDLLRLCRGLSVEQIWPKAAEFLGDEPGYYTAFCSYGGLTVYTLTENKHGSVCLEHGF